MRSPRSHRRLLRRPGHGDGDDGNGLRVGVGGCNGCRPPVVPTPSLMRIDLHPCLVRMADVGDPLPMPVVHSIAGIGQGDQTRLVSCIVCGQFMVWELSDWSPPPADQARLVAVAGVALCPRCKSKLSTSIRLAPNWFRCALGHVHTFDPLPAPPPPNSLDHLVRLELPVLESLDGAVPDRFYRAR